MWRGVAQGGRALHLGVALAVVDLLQEASTCQRFSSRIRNSVTDLVDVGRLTRTLAALESVGPPPRPAPLVQSCYCIRTTTLQPPYNHATAPVQPRYSLRTTTLQLQYNHAHLVQPRYNCTTRYSAGTTTRCSPHNYVHNPPHDCGHVSRHHSYHSQQRYSHATTDILTDHNSMHVTTPNNLSTITG